MSEVIHGDIKNRLFQNWLRTKTNGNQQQSTAQLLRSAFYTGLETGNYKHRQLSGFIRDQRKAIESVHRSNQTAAKLAGRATPPDIPPPHPEERLTSETLTQANVLAWAREAFGESALNPTERAARVLEESLELAQAIGLAADFAERLVAHVYARRVGEVAQELGGLSITLMAMAQCVNLNLDDVTETEWKRVLTVPAATFAAKHQAKVDKGLADLARLPNDEFRWICGHCSTVNALSAEHCICGTSRVQV